MKSAIFNLRNVITVVICLAGFIVFSGCGNKGTNSNENKDNKNTELSSEENENGEKSAFKQFGIDIEKVKPNVAEVSEITLQYGNKVDKIVYSRKAAWKETSATDIDKEVGHAYNERMFNYIKTIAADGKIYKNKTMNSELTELNSYQDILDNCKGSLVCMVTWSYQYDGMWIDVYTDYSGLGKDIGISMNGSGSY